MGKSIQLKTAIPGPKSQEMLSRRQYSVPRGVSNAGQVFAEKAEGALITDVDGNTFIDFAGAIGSLNAGHRPPEVVSSLKRQIDQYLHTCFHVMMYEPYVTLAEKLAEITPGLFHKKTILLNSGAEAVENAVKIAKKYTGRPGVVSFSRGFHGRTLLGMSLTSKVRPYKYGFGPFAPSTYKASYPYLYHRPEGMSEDAYVALCLRQVEDFFLSEVPPEEIAAFILEPVQGEGGFIIPPKAFVQEIADICKQNGILFIADEIQTGFGRTGTMFAMERFGVEPDLITVSKSMGAGVPISAVVGRAEIMDAANPGELGGTYGGSPLGCVAALAVIQMMEKGNLPGRAEQIGAIMMKRFSDWKQRFEIIGDVRGLGAMTAIEFVEDRRLKIPAKALTSEIQQECYRQGVVLLTAGIYSNVLRFLTPLVITDEQLNEGLDVLENVIEKANAAFQGTQPVS